MRRFFALFAIVVLFAVLPSAPTFAGTPELTLTTFNVLQFSAVSADSGFEFGSRRFALQATVSTPLDSTNTLSATVRFRALMAKTDLAFITWKTGNSLVSEISFGNGYRPTVFMNPGPHNMDAPVLCHYASFNPYATGISGTGTVGSAWWTAGVFNNGVATDSKLVSARGTVTVSKSLTLGTVTEETINAEGNGALGGDVRFRTGNSYMTGGYVKTADLENEAWWIEPVIGFGQNQLVVRWEKFQSDNTPEKERLILGANRFYRGFAKFSVDLTYEDVGDGGDWSAFSQLQLIF